MNRMFSGRQSRFKCRSRSARAGFTLAELVVSIGILLLMLSLAGQVYTVTVKSTSQATALTAVNQSLRQFERILREDLRNVQPGSSMILIQGNPVSAYWTQDGKEADDDGDPVTGYPHISDPQRERVDSAGKLVPVKPRADILMIFTARKAHSYTNPQVMSNLQQVVYGHAELGEYVPNPNLTGPQDSFSFAPGPQAFPETNNYPSPTVVSPVPAQRWHLARRSVLMLPTRPPPRPPGIGPIDFLDDPDLLQAATDFIGAPPYQRNPPAPPQQCRPGDIRYCTYEQSVLLPATDNAGQTFPYWPWFLPEIFGDTQTAVPYANWQKPFARSLLDPAPPALYADRLAHYMLPRCASFKVEWALNPRSHFVGGRLDGAKEIYWLDPGYEADPAISGDTDDPLRPLQQAVTALFGNAVGTPKHAQWLKLSSLINDQSVQADGRRYSLADRFRRDPDPNAWQHVVPDGRANLVTFTAMRPHQSNSEPVPDDLFPGALRITIDVFDRAGRLDRPIRHVMVLPVGR